MFISSISGQWPFPIHWWMLEWEKSIRETSPLDDTAMFWGWISLWFTPAACTASTMPTSVSLSYGFQLLGLNNLNIMGLKTYNCSGESSWNVVIGLPMYCITNIKVPSWWYRPWTWGTIEPCNLDSALYIVASWWSRVWCSISRVTLATTTCSSPV